MRIRDCWLALGMLLALAGAASADGVKSDAERLKIIRPAAEGELVLEPTFVGCGVEFGAAAAIPGLRLEYRAAADNVWKTLSGAEIVHLPRTRDYRVSLRDLAEDTEYQVRLVGADNKVVKEGAFRTWKSEVPIAQTIELDAAGPLPKVISAKGTPEGWIRITAKPGTVLDFGESEETAVQVKGAAYVIFENLVIKGTRGSNVINVTDSQYVRFRNCDISRWGRTGKPRFDMQGRIFDPSKPAKGYGINFDGAIEIGPGSFGTVVERCYIHDPRGRANSWYYSHPAGPEAVVLHAPKGSTVLRWNDFVGSDIHRYNDAVESWGNFNEKGGFNRNADVYGNFMIFCNDDCIEMDGGQRNVRNFDNRFEAALCGVSVQGCMVSPSYCFRNLFAGMCEEFGAGGQTIKTGGGLHGPDARFYADDNIFWGAGSGVTMMNTLTAICRNNRFCGKQGIVRQEVAPAGSVFTDNQFNVTLAEEALNPAIPVRPLPFVLDRARFSGIKVAAGNATPATLTVTAKGGATACAYRIVQNEVFDWFTVTPAAGVIPANGELKLTVVFNPAKMNDRRHYRGAFLVRTESGLSRPVSLYAETDFVPPYHAEQKGDFVQYSQELQEGQFMTLAIKESRRFTFNIPQDGRYYFMIRAKKATMPFLRYVNVSVDNRPAQESRHPLKDYSTWTMLIPGKKFGDYNCHYDLKAGAHTVTLSGLGRSQDMLIDGLIVTDNPQSFEPR